MLRGRLPDNDLATSSSPLSGRRSWNEAELETALEACRRMVRQEEALGRVLDEDESGDVISEVACQTGRRWSETRAVMAALAGLADGPGPRCLKDVKDTTLTEDERGALERLLRNEDATTA